MLRTIKRMVFREAPRENAMAAKIRDVCRQIECVQDCFDLAEDEDLLDAYSYLLLSLKARYRYLLRTARECEKLALSGSEPIQQPVAAERITA